MPWKAGESGNPTGRPKGFGQIVRGATHEGEDLVNLALDLAKNAPPRVRMEAITWLADRGFGKVPEQSDIQVGVHATSSTHLPLGRKAVLLSRGCTLSSIERTKLKAMTLRSA